MQAASVRYFRSRPFLSQREIPMLWSRYNRLFRSERCGRLLYNALSNTLLEVDEAHYRVLEGFRDRGNGFDAGSDADFLAVLRENKVLVEAGEEERLLLARQYRRHAYSFDTSLLGLAICPTLRCNFRCPYCFEQSQQDGKLMSPETVIRLLSFIRSYKDIRHLTITWYGGEPALAFPVICDITEKIQALDLDFRGAGMITNGYLLDGGKIARLNELKIRSIQITLDGPQEVHDTRRVLPGGGPTFQHILNNVTALMDSPYDGTCTIRVNIDKQNLDRYIELRATLLERFKGKKFYVYPGQVHTDLTHAYGHSCGLDLKEWAEFNLDMHRQADVLQRGDFYPKPGPGGCVATMHHGFVVGPEGELYKCWEDVGKPEMVIGNIYEENPAPGPEPKGPHSDLFWWRESVRETCITNPELRALYSTGIDPYNDPVCRACDILPICDGGCPNKRLRTRHFGEEGLEFCSIYRYNLIPYIETCYDRLRTKEICAAVLAPGEEQHDGKGYRVVLPERTSSE